MVATVATLRPSQAEPASVSRRTLVLIGLVGLALAGLNLAMAPPAPPTTAIGD